MATSVAESFSDSDGNLSALTEGLKTSATGVLSGSGENSLALSQGTNTAIAEDSSGSTGTALSLSEWLLMPTTKELSDSISHPINGMQMQMSSKGYTAYLTLPIPPIPGAGPGPKVSEKIKQVLHPRPSPACPTALPYGQVFSVLDIPV
jgi:hypothetical protein